MQGFALRPEAAFERTEERTFVTLYGLPQALRALGTGVRLTDLFIGGP